MASYLLPIHINANFFLPFSTALEDPWSLTFKYIIGNLVPAGQKNDTYIQSPKRLVLPLSILASLF